MCGVLTQNLLQFLVSKGPGTHGIFRKNAGGQQCKDIRQQMDLGLDGNFTSPHVASSILKVRGTAFTYTQDVSVCYMTW